MLKIVVPVTVNPKRGKIGSQPHGLTLFLEPTPSPIRSPAPSAAQPQPHSPPPTGAGSAGRAPAHGVQVGDGMWESSTGDTPQMLQRHEEQGESHIPGLTGATE